MNLRRMLRAATFALILTLTLAACDILDDAPAGFDGGQIVDAEAACTAADPHPIGESIAEQFDIDYEQVMVWFCNGEGFDDILLALQSAELSGREPEVLLDESDVGWEAVWADDGIVDPERAGAGTASDSASDAGGVDDTRGASPDDDGNLEWDGGDDFDDGADAAPGDGWLNADGEIEWNGDAFRLRGIISDKREAQRALLVEVAGRDTNYDAYTVLVPHDIAFEELHEGDLVRIEGVREEDGDLVATWIAVEDAAIDEGDGPFDRDDDDLDDDLDGDFEDDDFDEEEGDVDEWDSEGYYCRNVEDEHPVGEAIADRYDVDYELVIQWFCDDNLGMGEIMLALQTGDTVDEPAGIYVERRLDGEGWGQIWQDLGLIGRPEDAGPPHLPPGQLRNGDHPGRGNDGVPPGQERRRGNPGRGNDGVPPGQLKKNPGTEQDG